MGLEKNVIVIKHHPYCENHHVRYPGTYSEKYDSHYCKICMRWLEQPCKCGGDDCEMFPGRPDNPVCGVKNG